MILEQAKDIASVYAEQPITDAVITVPVFFNQAERRALLRAAKMVDIKVLQLMNSGTAGNKLKCIRFGKSPENENISQAFLGN